MELSGEDGSALWDRCNKHQLDFVRSRVSGPDVAELSDDLPALPDFSSEAGMAEAELTAGLEDLVDELPERLCISYSGVRSRVQRDRERLPTPLLECRRFVLPSIVVGI